MRKSIVCGIVALALACVAPSATPALATTGWRLDSNSAPSYLQLGGEGRITASASNLGETQITPSKAHPLMIKDALPPGLEVPAGLSTSAIEGSISVRGSSAEEKLEECNVEEAHRKTIVCQTTQSSQSLAPYRAMKVIIPVAVSTGAASGEQNAVSISGGEASGQEVPAPAPLTQALTVKAEPIPFGIEKYEIAPENEDGSLDLNAGSHPYRLTTTLDLNEALAPEEAGGSFLEPSAPALAAT